MQRVALLASLLAASLAGAAAYSGVPGGPRPTTSTASSTAATPIERLHVAAPPRAEPKKAAPATDPLDLWSTPKTPQRRGPSVFKLNQGRAIDVLRHDYPRFFTSKPDLSIFAENIELHDSSGKRLGGLKQYERTFDALRFLRRTTMQDAQVGIRVVADDTSIRVRWNAKLWMRDPVLKTTTLVNGDPALVHIDGVSVYELNKDGLIYKHRLEDIVFTGQEPEKAVQLAFAWPATGYATPAAAVPFYKAAQAALLSHMPGGAAHPSPSEPNGHSRRAPPPQASAASGGETPMERAARERAEDAEKQKRLTELRTPKEEKKGLFGITAPQSCETSFDCESPMVCCDLLFASVCCTGGIGIPTTDSSLKGQMQRQAIPIPVERDRPPGSAPPQYPGVDGF